MSISAEQQSIDESQLSELQPLSTAASQYQLALADLVDGISSWRIWTMLAYQDIKLRYRRSIIGPFWITISMAITVYSMGYLYAYLFHQDLSVYYPFLVTGMLSWSLISTIVTDVTDGFSSAEGMIKQIKMPYTLYLHRIACRNMIIFFHNLIVLVPIMIIFHATCKVTLNTLIMIPGLLLLYLNTLTFGLVIAMIGARYRDIAQVIKSLLQVIFFMTPIMWAPSTLVGIKGKIIVAVNPVYAFIEMIRAPMLGEAPSLQSLIMALAFSVLSIFLAIKMFSRYRSRIVYWL